MDKIKLVNASGKVIERNKYDYERNVATWEAKGFKVHDGKPKAAAPKPEPVKKTTKKKKSKK